MKITLIAATVAAAVAVPAWGMAADPMAKGVRAAMAPATMVCRPTQSGEQPNAMLMAGKQALVCKSVVAMMKDNKPAGPDLSKALTPEQIDAAWRTWATAMMQVGGGGG
jgi:hypothetical protein